eukprot:gnl/MRDRNA2_/MRDRNA2_87226_c0_seq1.p1 gnl/MRDRNA2_/MRDRNA2_87226_c0~~gnl/MRDRNA2_/MRDRNA2_87226_c0_seq1.p1  ORF type:complete len:181 (+),score=40.02 gnl/MRDRNA2_/MRDRNA2_87226_c0_seq1:42-584(+)
MKIMQAMRFSLLFSVASLVSVASLQVSQNPCAGCDEEQAIRYQQCTLKFGDPCVELMTYEKPLYDGNGNKICKKDKRDRCIFYDASSGKVCPREWKGEKNYVTGEFYDCAPKYKTKTIQIKSDGPGTKRDGRCCVIKQKHDNCLKCKAKDCSHGTCDDFVNKDYYSERSSEKSDAYSGKV